MAYNTVRALQAVRHNGVLRIPGQTSGDNAQDFVVDDATKDRLVALGFVSLVSTGSSAPMVVKPLAALLGKYLDGQLVGLQDGAGNDISLPGAGGVAARGTLILAGGMPGMDTGPLVIAPYKEVFGFQLDSGSTSTTVSCDVSTDGVTWTAQALTWTWARSDKPEFTPPLGFSDPQAKYMKFTVLTGGPISIGRGY